MYFRSMLIGLRRMVHGRAGLGWNLCLLLGCSLCLAWPGRAKAQEPALDSVQAWQDSTWSLLFKSPESALVPLNRVLDHAQSLPDSVRSVSENHMGIYHANQGDVEAAKEWFEQALRHAHAQPKQALNVLQNWLLVAGPDAEWVEVEHYAGQIERLAQQLEWEEGLGRIACIKGNFHFQHEHYAEAIAHYIRGLEMLESVEDVTPALEVSLAVQRSNLANSYSKAGFRDLALQHYERASRQLQRLGRPVQACWVASNEMDQLLNLQQLDRADSALTAMEQQEACTGDAAAYFRVHRAKWHRLMQRPEQADAVLRRVDARPEGQVWAYFLEERVRTWMDLGQTDSATTWLTRHRADFQPGFDELFASLDELEIKLRAAEQPGSDWPVFAAYYDRLQQEAVKRMAERVHALHMVYQTDQMEREAVRLNQAMMALKRRQLWMRTALVLAAVLVGVGAVLAFQMHRRGQLERQLREQQQDHFNDMLKRKGEELVIQTMDAVAVELRLAKFVEVLAEHQVPPKLLRPMRRSQRLAAMQATFVQRFNGIHPNFSDQLRARFPHINAGDVLLAMCLKLDLGKAEIAQFLGLSPDGLKTRMRRFRERTGCPTQESLRDELP